MPSRPAGDATRLSVVIPAYEAERTIGRTIDAVCASVQAAALADAEIVLVDDGSTDRTAEVALAAADGRVPLRVVRQANRGRFLARLAGVRHASYEHVLLLDSRVTLDREALRFVVPRLAAAERVWNGHVEIDTTASPYAAFWQAIVRIFWHDYVSRPRETSFGADDFDRYPKGTGCFLAPRQLVLDAIAAFDSHYGDELRFVNDDTPLIRWIAQRERIRIAPGFACRYEARETLDAFVRHAFHRGTVFVDGHLRRESRFAVPAAVFFPLSLVVGLRLARRPALVAPVAGASSLLAAGVALAAGSPRHEARGFGLLAPVYAVAHGIGMWRGLFLLAINRRRAAS